MSNSIFSSEDNPLQFPGTINSKDCPIELDGGSEFIRIHPSLLSNEHIEKLPSPIRIQYGNKTQSEITHRAYINIEFEQLPSQTFKIKALINNKLAGSLIIGRDFMHIHSLEPYFQRR